MPTTPEQAHEVMLNFYARLFSKFPRQYRQITVELLACNAPLVFNCAGGKDRTGAAAVILLTALGVRARLLSKIIFSRTSASTGTG